MQDRDEIVLSKIDEHLIRMQRAIEEIRAAIYVMTNRPINDRETTAHRTMLTRHVLDGLMSGRWHRRNGDGFNVPSNNPREERND